ncbi:MAG: alpha/beta fold hydrolase [Chloroflexi bacterium]|nr:alpha/beta fold hydrolase [Chloroflexota bacterium]
MSRSSLDRPEQPARSYAEARERFDASVRGDPQQVDPASRSQLIGPGDRTQRAIVFFHGLTNSPRQFLRLGSRFTERGYTLFIPRLPYHGYRDRMTTELGGLTMNDLIDATAEAIDLAAGLADEVSVSGISLGGVLAVWAAQHRHIALAAPIAPAIGIYRVPYGAARTVYRALGRLPNRYIWWDPRAKQSLPGPPYAYYRFSTHALAQTQYLAYQLVDGARQQAPRARRVWMISNAADLAVSNPAAERLTKGWESAGATGVRAFRFPGCLKLFHDLVDPLQPNARPELVHPVLEQIMVTDTAPDPLALCDGA